MSGEKPAPRLYGRDHPFEIKDLPEGVFKRQIESLDADTQKKAIDKLNRSVYPEQEFESLRCGKSGEIHYACFSTPEARAFKKARAAASGGTKTIQRETGFAPVPIATPPVYHSKPGSTNVIYLDFNGHVVQNTFWNDDYSVTKWEALPLDLDNDPTTFNAAEQTFIQLAWQRISEDYAPFNVDVTTEEPAVFTVTTGRILITQDLDKNGIECPDSSVAGGVAYINCFNDPLYLSKYSPAWVYLGKNPFEDYIAEASSHEMGHNMGLRHDGTSTNTYYEGHGTFNDPISWGPIMGTGYDKNVTQWSKGQYFDANRFEDDLSIISNKLSYRTDDRGNTNAAATFLTVTGGATISSANANNKGIIERNTDVDVYAFGTAAGAITLNINPFTSSEFTRGGNLDIVAELYDSSNNLVTSSNPAGDTIATISQNVAAGIYYLHIKNTGTGDPLNNPPTGYTSYGSIGQYFIDGTIAADTDGPTAVQTIASVNTFGGTSHTFTVTYTDNVSVDVSTLDSSDIRITAPGGIDIPATFLGVDVTSNGTPRTATYRFTPPGGTWDFNDNKTYTATIQAGQVLDIYGNAASGTQTFTVNVSQTNISSVTGPANGTYLVSQNLDFTVNFSRAVTVNTVNGTPAIPLTIGAASKSAGYLSGSGTTALTFRYITQAGDIDADGIASASPIVLNGGTIRDSGGSDALLTFTPPVTSGVLADASPPVILNVSAPANGLYVAAQTLAFSVTFDDTVTVNTSSGTPAIALTIGSTTRNAAYVSGSGTTTLLFQYVVQANELDSDGIAASSPLSLNGGTIKDAESNDAVLSFTAPNLTSVLVDSTPPVISISAPSVSLTRGGPATFTITYAGADTVTLALTDIILNKSGTNATVAVTGSGLTTRTVTLTNISGDGTLGISLAAGTASDNALNQAAAAGPSATITVDNTRPQIASIDRLQPASSVTNSDSIAWKVTFSEDVSNVDAADFTLTAVSGSLSGQSISGVTAIDARTYSVSAASTGGDGVLRLDLPGAIATISDLAGNTLNADFTSGQTFTIDRTLPQITSNPAAGAPLGVSGEAVTFTAAASDANGVTYTWNFGDGTIVTTTESSIQHVFGAPSTYSITVTATDPGGLTTEATTELLVISPASVGDICLLLNPIELKVQSLAVKLAFPSSLLKDSLSLKALLQLKDGFNPDGQEVHWRIGHIEGITTLDAKGSSPKSKTVSVKLKFKKPKTGEPFIARTGALSISLKSQSLASFTLGGLPDVNVNSIGKSGDLVTADACVVLTGHQAYQMTQMIGLFKGKKDKAASFSAKFSVK